jgi:3-oxoadipate enol-lactonase
MTEATPRSVHVGPAPRLAVDVMGEGPLLLFLHGIGGNRSNWLDQLPAFARHFTAVAWDARGYGDSDDYEGPLAFDDFAHDLRRVVDHFDAARAHLVGLSMGGRISMRFALLYPERVATLTLVDTDRGFSTLSAEKRAEFVASRREPLLAGKEPRDIADRVSRSLMSPSASPEVLARLVASISALHKESYLKSLEATVNQDLVGDLTGLTMPTHFVVGAEDRLTPPHLSEAMHRDLPGSALTVIPGAGHLSNIEKPAEFNAAVLAFLLRHRDR